MTEQTEINIKNSTKEGKIKVLVWLSNHFNDRTSFKGLTKLDILDYLNSLRKSYEEDPRQKWIGSYNNRQMILTKFFKWLYNQRRIRQQKEANTSLHTRNTRITNQRKNSIQTIRYLGFSRACNIPKILPIQEGQMLSFDG